jgi:hypothetical protein
MADKTIYTQTDEICRRQFMLQAARTYLGVAAAPMLGATIATEAFGAAAPPLRPRAAKNVIFLNMSGGMSHLDTWDVKPKAKEEVRGPIRGIRTNVDDLMISEYLKNTANIMDKVCIINSMNTNQGAHEQGQYILHRSYPMRGTIVHPAIGSWVLRLSGRRNETIPGFVTIGSGTENASGGFMGAKYSGVPIGNPNDGLKDSARAGGVTEVDFNKRLALADKMNTKFHGTFNQKQVQSYQGLYEEAVRLMTSEDLKAFDLGLEDQKTRGMYGGDSFGQGCLLARRLIEHNVRFVEVTLGGWDTHYDNFASVESRAAVLDTGFSALITDLERRGLLDDTLVAIGTEFGRTPEIVKEHQDGRDHFPSAFSCVLAGGGVKGGIKYGSTDGSGKKVVDKLCTPLNFNATIAYALGLPGDRVVTSPSGRPFWVANKAEPIKEIFPA